MGRNAGGGGRSGGGTATIAGRVNARSIPASSSDRPSSNEIFRQGVLSTFRDPARGINSNSGNVLRGADGNFYAQAGGSVRQVFDARPARASREQIRRINRAS